MLKNVSLLFYYQKDSQDRENNLFAVLEFYRKNAPGIEIQIVEEGTEQTLFIPGINYTFWQKQGVAKRPQAFNCMSRQTDKPVIVSHDVDTVVHIESLKMACDAALSQAVVIPYSGLCIDVHKNAHVGFKAQEKCEGLAKYMPPEGAGIGWHNECTSIMNVKSVGGIVCFNSSLFKRMGGYNPNFKGWGWEDVEILERYNKLGYNWTRVFSERCPAIFHLNHERPDTEYMNAQAQNAALYHRVKSMSPAETAAYIETWKR